MPLLTRRRRKLLSKYRSENRNYAGAIAEQTTGRGGSVSTMRLLLFCSALYCASLLGCGGDAPTESIAAGGTTPVNTDPAPTDETPVDDGVVAPPAEVDDAIDLTGLTAVGYTYHRPDGNRLAAGTGNVPAAATLDIALEGVPQWVVAAPAGRGSVWMVALQDGRVATFRIVDGVSVPVPLAEAILPVGTPPVLAIDGDLRPRLANVVDGEASILSHPVLLSDNRLAYLTAGGDLVLQSGLGSERLAIDPLPDARILVDENERLLIYNRPTTRYDHAVLGDDLEAQGAVLIETDGGLQAALQIDFEPVAEGIAPLWVDLDGDGDREIIATLSDAANGARVAVFTAGGLPLATGAAIGQGFRWRHQLAIATFAEDEVEIAVVRTPHIGGIVEFYRRRDAVLDIVTQLDGFSSHLLDSRNLDMGLAGDFDGDGVVELLLPTQDFERLGSIERVTFGAQSDWEVELGGRLSTNIAAVQQSDGGMLVGAGHEGEVLRVWLP